MGIADRKIHQRQALRERILDAARRIVMREGFGSLSMRKIADAIDYSPATLYLHFASRDEIARALCEEGYAQLLETLGPLTRIVDPAERLRAIGRAYVAFGVEHPRTYRLIFMEDPSYTGAVLGGASGASRNGVGDGKRAGRAAAADTGGRDADDQASREAAHVAAAAAVAGAPTNVPTNVSDNPPPIGTTGDSPDSPGHPASDASDAADASALHIMINAFDELRAAGQLSAWIASMDPAVWADALWASLHGIVALNLTYPAFPSASRDEVVDATLDAWLAAPESPRPRRKAARP